MARETLKDFLISIGATSDMITYTISDDNSNQSFDAGDDLGVDPGTNRDLVDLQSSGVSPGLLGDYLQFLISHSDNLFTLQGGNEKAASSNRGEVLVPAEDQGVERPFIRNGDTLGSVMASYSNSGMFGENLDEIIDKTGRLSPRMQDDPSTFAGHPDHSGNTLLSSIEGTDVIPQSGITEADATSYEPESVAQETVENFLTENSRFNPSRANFKAFAPNPTSATDFDAGEDDAGTTTSQSLLGDYDKSAVTMILDNLKNVGASLMLKSAGWDVSYTPGSSSDPDNFLYTTSANHDHSDLLRTVDPDVLRAMNAAGAPEREVDGLSTRAGRGDLLTHDDLVVEEGAENVYSLSFGSTYTDDLRFQSITNRDVLVAQATAAIVAVMTAAKETLTQITNSIGARAKLHRGPYFAGESSDIALEAKFQLFRKIVIVSTEHNYDDCVEMGLQVLFSEGAKMSSADSQQIENYQQIQEAPGYWLAVARTVLRNANLLSTGLATATGANAGPGVITEILFTLSRTKIIGFLNVAATVGDIFLKMTGGNKNLNAATHKVGPRNVDLLPDGPATRISKSRSGQGQTSLSLAWRGSSAPGAYLIPRNVINTAIDLGTLSNGANPLKGMMTNRELATKTYIDPNMEGANARIPGHVVERLENQLDAEYVPFYFHDIRTNEIIAFHAFLGSLSDRYSPNYSSVRGYGRIDPVQVYQNTNRRVSLTFYAVSTSKEDFNEMWWKINKLVTLVYPQWTQGTKVSKTEGPNTSVFVQPFSQVMGASPLIRLRVGDVIKGNYSKFNLARIFGIGDSDVYPYAFDAEGFSADASAVESFGTSNQTRLGLDKVFYKLFGTPLAGMERGDAAIVSGLMGGGFANPAGMALILTQLRDPDSVQNPVPMSLTVAGIAQSLIAGVNQVSSELGGYIPGTIQYLRATSGTEYVLEESTGSSYRVMRPFKVMIIGRPGSRVRGAKIDQTLQNSGDAQQNYVFKGPTPSGVPKTKRQYRVVVVDLNAPARMVGKVFLVSHSDIMPDPDVLFNSTVMPFISGLPGVGDALARAALNAVAQATGAPADLLDLNTTAAADFMKSENNPIVKAFESARGRGLAGVISSLDFEWLEFPWETDWNSRAPMACKVSMSFNVIHDIPPGLDHSGYNRAPVYNVGDVMRYVAGDPYNDDGLASKWGYTEAGRLGTVSDNPEEN